MKREMKRSDNQLPNQKGVSGFRRRTMREILKTWEKLKSITRMAITGRLNPDLSEADEEHIKTQIHQCVYARGGEISSRSRAVELGKTYLKLSRLGRDKFLKILSRDFDVDNSKIIETIKKYKNSEENSLRKTIEVELQEVLVPPRVKLLRQFNSLPNGFKFLVDLRAEFLDRKGDDPYLEKLDADLKSILSTWFDVELLDLEEITWDSPASLLEKLIEYEAVHEIQSWADLKNRLDSDRQCFAFFHNKMPDEPLIFVEVALVNEISASIQKLLDEEAKTINPEKANTAIFYSISNAQKGLAGINLGNFLIKRVVNRLMKKLKNVKHFATLSPVPGFRKWLDKFLEKGDESVLNSSEIKIIKENTVSKNAALALLVILKSNWFENSELVKILKPILMRLCAFYLLAVKKEDKAFDPVANFHLSNGARIESLNWLGDISEKGMRQSAGMMVNYYYKLSEIEKKHELYITASKISVSKEVRKWLS